VGDNGGLEIGVEIETRACNFRCVGSDCIMPGLTQLLPQPEIDRLARERNSRGACADRRR
jgi:hypothetical protein